MPLKNVHAYSVTMKTEKCADDVCSSLYHLDDKEKEIEVDFRSNTVKVCTYQSADKVMSLIKLAGKPTQLISTVTLTDPRYLDPKQRGERLIPTNQVLLNDKLTDPPKNIKPNITSASWTPPKQY